MFDLYKLFDLLISYHYFSPMRIQSIIFPLSYLDRLNIANGNQILRYKKCIYDWNKTNTFRCA